MDGTKTNCVAIVCAKKDSIRYPNKNRDLIAPVLNKLLKFTAIDKIVVATNDKDIGSKKKSKRLRVIRRRKNACVPEDSVFNVARWAYYCLNESYDQVIVVLPNVINFKASALAQGLRILRENNLNEVRTYCDKGVENGVIIMKEDWFLNGTLSVYCGAVISQAKEIHYEWEVNE
jgi:CMP-N-acetylneuraminic acid synthetase